MFSHISIIQNVNYAHFRFNFYVDSIESKRSFFIEKKKLYDKSTCNQIKK